MEKRSQAQQATHPSQPCKHASIRFQNQICSYSRHNLRIEKLRKIEFSYCNTISAQSYRNSPGLVGASSTLEIFYRAIVQIKSGKKDMGKIPVVVAKSVGPDCTVDKFITHNANILKKIEHARSQTHILHTSNKKYNDSCILKGRQTKLFRVKKLKKWRY